MLRAVTACGFAADVLVFVNGFFLNVERAEADDDAMHRCHAARLVAPLEGAVGEVDMYALREQPAPQYAGLFALRNAVGGDEARTVNGRVAL